MYPRAGHMIVPACRVMLMPNTWVVLWSVENFSARHGLCRGHVCVALRRLCNGPDGRASMQCKRELDVEQGRLGTEFKLQMHGNHHTSLSSSRPDVEASVGCALWKEQARLAGVG